jgi:hypothetical protein
MIRDRGGLAGSRASSTARSRLGVHPPGESQARAAGAEPPARCLPRPHPRRPGRTGIGRHQPSRPDTFGFALFSPRVLRSIPRRPTLGDPEVSPFRRVFQFACQSRRLTSD